MSLVVDRLAVRGPHGPLLTPTSFTAETGEVTIVAGDPGPSGVALALAVGGRMRGATGTVTLGDGPGSPTPARRLRETVALVDVPDVTEPDPVVPVRVVVGEELALAGLPAKLGDIHRFISEHADGEDLAGLRWEQCPVDLHTRWLLWFASQRCGVQAVVLTHPDRWGGDPHDWYAAAREIADRGLIVVVTCTHASARLLGLTIDHEIGVSA